MGAYDFGGGALTGYKKDSEVDEFERKDALRKNRRRPIEQTISEIGEGRGKTMSCSSWSPADMQYRHLRPGIRGAETRKNQRKIWY